jgi:hypothetical protein
VAFRLEYETERDLVNLDAGHIGDSGNQLRSAAASRSLHDRVCNRGKPPHNPGRSEREVNTVSRPTRGVELSVDSGKACVSGRKRLTRRRWGRRRAL